MPRGVRLTIHIYQDPALPKDGEVEQTHENPEPLAQSKKPLKFKRAVRASSPSIFSSDEDPIHVN